MKTIMYVSHPYSGNEDGNVTKTENLVRELTAKYPDVIFLSPVLAFDCLRDQISYDEAMVSCITLLKRCDSIVLCGNWRDSKGCNVERLYALGMGLKSFEYQGEGII